MVENSSRLVLLSSLAVDLFINFFSRAWPLTTDWIQNQLIPAEDWFKSTRPCLHLPIFNTQPLPPISLDPSKLSTDMGNAGLSSCCSIPASRKRLVKLVFWGGSTELLQEKQLAGELMCRFPDRVVCCADSFYIGRPVPALAIEDELLPGRTYFVLPVDRFQCNSPLTAVALSALSPGPARSPTLVAGGQRPFAYVKGADGRMLIKVLPEFIAKVISSEEASGRSGEDGCGALCSTPELKKHYAQLVGPRERPWSPKLETISERKRRALYEGSLSPVRLLGLAGA